jgi:endonuclease YncB( thermonuclease family)
LRRRSWLGQALAIALLFAAVIAAIVVLEPAIPPIGGVARASDGDSLRIGEERVRLIGIDAPELEQTCTIAAEAWPCGEAARNRLRDLLNAGEVDCRPDGRDRYGRVLAYCDVNDVDLGGTLVSEGLAVSYGEYLVEELVARSAERGVWRGEFERPEDWRRTHREESDGLDLFAWIRSLF